MINHISLIPSSKSIKSAILVDFLPAFLAIFLAACNFLQYTAKPIDPVANTIKFETKDPAGQSFNQYLLNNGYKTEQLPISVWGLDELTFCALFFHPSLDVARAQWRAAELSELAAAEKPIPNLNGNLAHSNRANGDISPFAFGLSIDIPIETANKRDIRIENAHHLSQSAKLEIAQIAWELRNQIAQTLIEYQFNACQIKSLNEEQLRRQEIVAIYQKRVALGAASNIELSVAKLQLQTTTAELNANEQTKLVLLSELASHLGLPLNKVAKITLVGGNNNLQSSDEQTWIQQNWATQTSDSSTLPADAQTSALLNRLDIRIALEKYAIAEAKLKLEIAKQYPDITISPGYAYEFGDRIWSLGLSSLFTLLNKNKVAITEATQLREVEAAQFTTLQSKVIAEVNVANAQVIQAKLALDNQQQLFKQEQINSQRMSRQFAAGEIDRLALTFVKLEDNAAEKSLALGYFQLKTALNTLENTLQKPIISSQFKATAVEPSEIKGEVKNEP